MEPLKLIPTKFFDSYLNESKIDWAIMKLPTYDVYSSLSSIELSNSIAVVYSSRIEGEEFSLEAFLSCKQNNAQGLSVEIQRLLDLFKAYEFAQLRPLTFENVMKAHSLLSKHLLPVNAQGKMRNNISMLMDEAEKITYFACSPFELENEMRKLFQDIERLLNTELSVSEVFYYASLIHFLLVKIHPMMDGNGRLTRLVEKWFITSKLGPNYWLIRSEKYYYRHLKDYYLCLAKAGFEYESINWEKGLSFLQILPQSISFNE